MADLIGSTTACEILGADRSTITRWVAAGRLTPAGRLRDNAGAFVFDRGEVERFRVELASEPMADQQ